MRPPKKRDLSHFLDPVVLDGDITDLQAKFKDWKTADDRGNTRVWTLLGKAYELGSAIADDDQARNVLVTKVSEDPDVQKSNKWDASRKHPFDLLLVLLLGLKEETKATKSQWLRTLEAAKKAKLSPSQDVFAVWIRKSGGIAGVLKPRQRPAQERKTISQLAEGLEPEFDFKGIAGTITKSALKCQNNDLPEGFALILVKESDEEGRMWPLASIVDERQISTAIRSVLTNHKMQELATIRGHEEERKSAVHEVRRAARKKFNADRKAKRYHGTFDDFLEEFIGEIENHGLDHLAHFL